jgi:hypothetical protein
VTGGPVLGMKEERSPVNLFDLKQIHYHYTDDGYRKCQYIQYNAPYYQSIAQKDKKDIADEQKTVYPSRNMQIIA